MIAEPMRIRGNAADQDISPPGRTLEQFHSRCAPKRKAFTWFSTEENHTSRSWRRIATVELLNTREICPWCRRLARAAPATSIGTGVSCQRPVGSD